MMFTFLYPYRSRSPLLHEPRGIVMIEYDGANNPRRIQPTDGNVTE